MRKGLIKYLECKLHRLYQNIHSVGNIDMHEIKRLKDKINNIKEHVLEGIKIRARIEEQVDGEKASSSLLGKQSNSKSKPIITQIKLNQMSNPLNQT